MRKRVTTDSEEKIYIENEYKKITDLNGAYLQMKINKKHKCVANKAQKMRGDLMRLFAGEIRGTRDEGHTVESSGRWNHTARVPLTRDPPRGTVFWTASGGQAGATVARHEGGMPGKGVLSPGWMWMDPRSKDSEDRHAPEQLSGGVWHWWTHPVRAVALRGPATLPGGWVGSAVSPKGLHSPPPRGPAALL